MTGSSTLDPDNFPSPPDRSLGRGHGTRALGPSDSSDSGSDVSSGLSQQFDTGMRQGISAETEMEFGMAGGIAGADLGDSELDSDSDSNGTGERAAAGRDTVSRDGADIDVDHIETLLTATLDELDGLDGSGVIDRNKDGRRT